MSRKTPTALLLAAIAILAMPAAAGADDTGVGPVDAVVDSLFPPPPPPETMIDSGPAETTTETTATFGFSSDVASASFECSLDGAEFAPCSSPATYEQLSVGTHNFQVRAVDVQRGTDPTPARRAVTVEKTETQPAPEPPPTGGGDPGPAPAPAPTSKQKPCKPVPRPLIQDALVRKRPGMLLISVQLAAKARVRAEAYRGAKVIGRTRAKVLKPGSHEIRLRYSGRGKPTRLQMRARPAIKNACSN